MGFINVTRTRTLITGALQTETGSEVLFGYRPNEGLEYLQGFGTDYDVSDPEWREAHLLLSREFDTHVPMGSASRFFASAPTNDGPPRTVTRHVAGYDEDDSLPLPGDPRVVGDLDSSGADINENDLAQRAAAFLEGGVEVAE